MIDNLREQISRERKEKMARIGNLQNDIAKLEAELRTIAIEEEERLAANNTHNSQLQVGYGSIVSKIDDGYSEVLA